MPNPKENFKRLNADVPEQDYRSLKVKLFQEGLTFTDWLGEQVKKFIKK